VNSPGGDVEANKILGKLKSSAEAKYDSTRYWLKKKAEKNDEEDFQIPVCPSLNVQPVICSLSNFMP
jgi:hypothetical protein